MMSNNQDTNRRLYFLALTALMLSAITMPKTAHAESDLGVNISEASYWGREQKFTNMMKSASGNMGINIARWMTKCSPFSQNQIEKEGCMDFRRFPNGNGYYAAYNTGEQDKLILDDLGYPVSLPDPDDRNIKFRGVTAIVLHPDANNDAGDYVVLYEGEGTLGYSGVTRVSSQLGRDVVRYAAGNQFDITIEKTTLGNHIRNIRVIPPGGACSSSQVNFTLTAAQCVGTYTPLEEYANTHLFHPRFTADLKGMRVLRFMDAMFTNLTDKDPETDDPRHTLINWSDRARRDSASYTELEGFPFPVLIDLAVEVGASPWINIGYRAQNDVATNLGKLLARRFKPGMTFYIEYGNEPWNTAPAFIDNYRYLATMGNDKFGSNSNTEFERVINYYALRSSEICQLVKAKMGTNASAVKCVLNNQQGAVWQNEQTLSCPMVVERKLLGDKKCADIMDVSAIAPYFGDDVGHVKLWPGNEPYKDRHGRTVEQWLRDGDRGLGALFEDLEYTQLPQALQRMKDSKGVADAYGKIMMAYEGGQHLLDYGGRDAVKDLFAKANRDARMGAMYTKYMTDWKSTGAETMVLFNNVSAYGSNGSWGLREYIQQTSTPKWDAVKAFRDLQ
ncbi:MAG: hypothetical protein HYS20_08565 [Rhodocyclales bacterium]|nr:hypothetical protein [Rhodocyclales bacterium]